MKTLKEHLVDWNDVDVAKHKIALIIGALPDDGERYDIVLICLPDLDCMLTKLLRNMLETDMLEEDNDQKVRWNANYTPFEE